MTTRELILWGLLGGIAHGTTYVGVIPVVVLWYARWCWLERR